MQLYKKPVSVYAIHHEDGHIQPVRLILAGKEYLIDHIDEYVPALASLAGSCGECWRIRILGVKRNLYLEEKKRWFLESLKP